MSKGLIGISVTIAIVGAVMAVAQYFLFKKYIEKFYNDFSDTKSDIDSVISIFKK